MIARLEQILKEYNLSPSRFAERMGIQRSGISHILAGRNRPSYDFFVRLAEEFPEININWLVSGKGSMYIDEKPLSQDLIDPGKNEKSEPDEQQKENPALWSGSTKDTGTDKDTQSKVYNDKQRGDDDIDHIIILFGNGRFKRYIPD